jgi:hypothetical protein
MLKAKEEKVALDNFRGGFAQVEYSSDCFSHHPVGTYAAENKATWQQRHGSDKGL